MLNAFNNTPGWTLVACFFGAIFTWFAADHFRTQILSDTHRLVREVALRYLQVMIGLFAVFVLGGIMSFSSLSKSTITNLRNPQKSIDIVTDTLIVSPTITIEPIVREPGGNEIPLTEPTSPLITTEEVVAPPIEPVKKAMIINTNGFGVNVREVAGLGGFVVQVAAEGAIVTLVGPTEEADGFLWYQVILPEGSQGWIASKFLEFLN